MTIRWSNSAFPRAKRGLAAIGKPQAGLKSETAAGHEISSSAKPPPARKTCEKCETLDQVVPPQGLEP